MSYLDNRNWIKSISEEEVQNKEFSIAYLLNTNSHNDLIRELRDKVLAKYKIIAEFNYKGYNGDTIKANGQTLVYRKSKNSELSFGKNVKYLSGNLSNKGGGSNRYPSVRFENAKCTLEFISYGLPYIDELNGWDIRLIELKEIEG